MGFFSKIGNLLGGGLSGALPGFLLGGPVGALIGGGLGALGGATSKRGRMQQQPLLTPEQKQYQDMMMRQGAQDISGEGMEKRYMDQFQREIIPDLMAQFTGMGGSGEGRSSAFGETLGMSGSDLASRLAALRQQGGMQKMQMGMQPQFQTQYMKGQPGIGQDVLGSLMPLLGMNMMTGGQGLGFGGRGAGRGPQYAKGQPSGFQGGSFGGLARLLMGR